MNILFVTGMFVKENASVGGMPGYIYKASSALKERGHNVYILTADNETRKWEYRGITVYSVKVFPHITRIAWVTYGIHNVLRDITLQKVIRKIALELEINIIQYTGWFGVGLFHSRRLGIPAVMRMSSYAKVQLVSSFTDKQISVISTMERWASRNMDAIFAPSKVIAEGFAKDIEREVRIIETPFQLEIPKESWDFTIYEKVRGKQYLLFFGRMTPDKGILTIARSIYRILCEHKKLYFVFAGDLVNIEGKSILDILFECGQEHTDRIIYLGSLLKEQMYPIINNAYAILIPSLMDNLPNSCMEAMYLRKVVIGTRGTSLDQLIHDNVSGLLIDPDDEEMLVNRINEVLGMALQKRKELGEKAHDRIMMLRPEITIKELEDYYISVKNSYKK